MVEKTVRDRFSGFLPAGLSPPSRKGKDCFAPVNNNEILLYCYTFCSEKIQKVEVLLPLAATWG